MEFWKSPIVLIGLFFLMLVGVLDTSWLTGVLPTATV